MSAGVLLALWGAFFANRLWLWGVLFLVWALPDFFSRRTYLAGVVYRSEQPVLYWCGVSSWCAIGLYLIGAGIGLLPS